MRENKMSQKTLLKSSLWFAFIIVFANYTVQFPINDWLTYGALAYPFSFLLTDVLSEKYSKEEVLKVVKYGVLMAIVPTLLIADYRIAFASIVTFFLIQHLDVISFHYLKVKFEKLWWLRNNLSTITSQFLDTVLFFFLAFAWVLPFDVIVKLIIGDYMIKVILALLDTPVFYYYAIRIKHKISRT